MRFKPRVGRLRAEIVDFLSEGFPEPKYEVWGFALGVLAYGRPIPKKS